MSAVRTAGGERFEVDAAVLATGAAVPAWRPRLGIAIPDATPISLLVTTKPLAHRLHRRAEHAAGLVASRRPGGPGGRLRLAERVVTQAPDGRYRVPDAMVKALLAEADPPC